MRSTSFSMQPYLRGDVCRQQHGVVFGTCYLHLRLSATPGIGCTWVSLPPDRGSARISHLLFCMESRSGEPSGRLSSDDAPSLKEDVGSFAGRSSNKNGLDVFSWPGGRSAAERSCLPPAEASCLG